MISKSYRKTVIRIGILLQILLAYSLFNIAAANNTSCGAPSYNRATDSGIYLWRICSTGEWTMRAVGGGRASNNELRVEGFLTSSSPIQTISSFSLEPPDPNELLPEPDFVDISDRTNIKFRFRVWVDAQDGMDFKIPANATACLSIFNPQNMPIFVGGSKSEVLPPFNLISLEGDGCAGAISAVQLLLFE